MKAMKLMVLVLVLLSLIPTVHSAEYECNGNLLMANITYQKYVNGSFVENRTYEFVDDVCDYGCEPIKDVCNPAPYEQTIILGMILAVIFMIGWFFYSKI